MEWLAESPNLLKSNLVQIFLTIGAGAAFYFLFILLGDLKILSCRQGLMKRLHTENCSDVRVVLLRIFSLVVTFLLLLSFIFNIGEVYQYSHWYKRTFFYFGDGFPILMILPLLVFFRLSDWRFVSIILLSLVISGGRATILLALLAMMMLAGFKGVRWHWKRISKITAFLVLTYFIVLAFSNWLNGSVLGNSMEMYSPPTAFMRHEDVLHRMPGAGVCANLENCYKTQVVSAFRQRLFSTMAGAWMTFNGGFAGKNYPNDPTKFADLMMKYDPYGMNEKYGITWSEWSLIREVQNPYFNFGSGYGWQAMFMLVAAFLSVAFLGIWNIHKGKDVGVWSSLTIYFLLIVVFCQFQPWIQSGSGLLFIASMCGMHIVDVRFERRPSSTALRHLSAPTSQIS